MTDFTDDRLRIVFAGTPDFAAHHLQVLLDADRFELVAAYTQPDRPKGRGKNLAASPVKILAEQHQIPVYQPINFKTPETQQQFADLKPDLMVVVAYGLLLPKVILDMPRLGCINVHASLLPRWRGAAPIQRAIEAGDKESGVTIMQMAEGLDTGDMLVKATTQILTDDTAATLHDKLAEIGGPALLKAIDRLEAGTDKPQPQNDEQANYAAKLSKSEAQIDWQLPAVEIDRKVRAFNPFPVATTELDGERVRIWSAQPTHFKGSPGEILQADSDGLLVGCGEGSLLIKELQLPNKKRLPVADLLRGNSMLFQPGKLFL